MLDFIYTVRQKKKCNAFCRETQHVISPNAASIGYLLTERESFIIKNVPNKTLHFKNRGTQFSRRFASYCYISRYFAAIIIVHYLTKTTELDFSYKKLLKLKHRNDSSSKQTNTSRLSYRGHPTRKSVHVYVGLKKEKRSSLSRG